MQKNIIYLLFLGMIGLSVACTTTADPTPSNEVSAETLAKITAYGTSKGLTFTKTTESVFYTITKANASGRVPVFNEYAKINYVFTKLDGTILDSSAIKRKIPWSLLYSATSTSLTNYAVSLMKEGESAVIVFPTTTQSADPIVMTTTLLSTRNETEQIDEYAKEKFANLPILKTISGMQYVITKTSASGDAVVVGKSATVAYTGKFTYQYRSTDTNGFPIYTDRFDSGSFSFVIGGGGVVAGFDEAAKLMKVGDKGIFVFPSPLGYGTTGKGTIPPYTPLVFEMEITSVK
jgi:FKBP-type peptidyl-prolyl cis-trans isomerase